MRFQNIVTVLGALILLILPCQAQTAFDGDVVGPIVIHTARYDPKDETGRRIDPTTPVIVGITVDEKGSPQNIHVVRSSGVPEADAASVQAVAQYRFKPARENSRPVSVALYIELSAHAEPLSFRQNGTQRQLSPINPKTIRLLPNSTRISNLLSY
jgi:TonB family protein